MPCNLQSTVQNENEGPLIQKLLWRMLRHWLQGIKPGMEHFWVWGSVWLHKTHTHEASLGQGKRKYPKASLCSLTENSSVVPHLLNWMRNLKVRKLTYVDRSSWWDRDRGGRRVPSISVFPISWGCLSNTNLPRFMLPLQVGKSWLL